MLSTRPNEEYSADIFEDKPPVGNDDFSDMSHPAILAIVASAFILCCFLVGAPWTVMGLWNAVIGIWLLHGRKDGLGKVAPHLQAMDRHVFSHTGSG